DVKELDYDDAQDKDNPHNWPAWKKWMVTYTVAFMCLCCSLGSSMYTGGVPEIMIRFGASQELSLAGLTFYLIGLALGPAIAAPLSEVFGRRWIYILSLPIAMLFTMGVGLAKNMGTILVLRFFCGYFASPAMAMGGGTISDIWSKEPAEQSFAIALFCLCPFLGPVLGPVIGGFAGEHKNWQWAASWVLLMFFGFVWPFVILSPETYKPVILKNRAIKRGMKVNAPKINSAFIKRVIFFDLLRPIQLLFKEPIVFFFSVYVSFIFAVLFAFFEAFPVIFRGVYHMDLGVSGLTFISVGIGLILGIAFYVVLDKVYYFPKNPDGTRGKRDENGNIVWDAPETKLLVAQIGSVFLPISLFWLGWTAKPSIHYMAPVAAGIPFGFGLILVFLAVVLYFSMSFPPMNVASAIAANNLLRYLLASVFPLFTVQCYENLGIGWASSLFAFIALAMVPVPFIFSYFGPRLRAKSKYGYAAFFKKLAEEKAAAAAAAASAAPAEKQEATEDVVSDKV
ncbi:polyamine transport protein, partial [Spathaspora passalidarum NRRL Y-27907]